MPLEGHWQRVNAPLRTLTVRERRIVGVAIGLVLAAALAIALVAASAKTTPLARGCIAAIVPGAMGGQPVGACGKRAQAICSTHANSDDPGSRAIEESCRRQGVG